MPSTSQCKNLVQEHTFSKVSAVVQSNAMIRDEIIAVKERAESSSSSQDERIISGDLNFLLDREIQKVSFVPKAVQIRGGCNSTSYSSEAKSPMANYGAEQP